MLDTRLARFLVVVRCGSFSRAENTLHLSKQALAKQINSLEEELGFRLLDRGRTGVSLTPAGQVLYESARRIQEELNSAIEKSQIVASQKRCIRLGRFKLHVLLDEVNRRFSLEHPEIELKQIISPTADPFIQVLEQLNDVAETPWTPDIHEQGLEYIKLVDLPYQCLMSKKHPLTLEQRLSPEKLSNTPVTIYRQQWKEEHLAWLSSVLPGLRILETLFYHVKEIYSVCEQGGIFITPAYYAYFLDPLARVPLDVDFTWEYGICYRKNPSGEVQKYLETAQKIYENRQFQ